MAFFVEHNFYTGLEVFIVVIETSVFWNITPCSPVKSHYVSEEHVASIFKVA
jgi:hypothetical protein